MDQAANNASLEEKNVRMENEQVAYLTLCDLVESVSLYTKNDRLTAKIVAHLLNTGKVKLIGSFKGKKLTFV